MIDSTLQIPVAVGLALLFAAAARHKLSDTPRFAAQLAEYRLLPAALTVAAARLLAALELAVAAALLFPSAWAWAGAAGAALLLTYAGAIGINLLRGRNYIDCGCGDTPVLLSAWLLLRNGLLAGGALLLMLPDAARTLSWWDLALGVPALLVLVLVYSATEQLLTNQSLLREWRQSHG